MKTILILTFGLTFTTFSQTIVFTDDFQNGISSNWKFYNGDGLVPVDPIYSDSWILTTDPEDASNSIISSTSYFQPIGKANRWAISPTFNLGSYGNSISWKAKSKDASFLDGYIVLGSKSGTNIADFKDTLYIQKAENSYWTEREIDLSEKGYNAQNVNIAFVNNTNNGFKLFLDSIVVEKESSLGIDKLIEPNLLIYPNPVQNLLNIKTSSSIQSISVINSMGQNMIHEKNTSSINLEQLKSGVYFIEVISTDFMVRKQFIKE